MAVYCLCDDENGVIDSSYEKYSVVINEPVECIKTGATSFTSFAAAGKTDRNVLVAYKNVDVSKCRSCGHKIAVG